MYVAAHNILVINIYFTMMITIMIFYNLGQLHLKPNCYDSGKSNKYTQEL